MLALPADPLGHVFSFLRLWDLAVLARSCKKMMDAAYSKSALGDARRFFAQLRTVSDADGATALKRKLAAERTEFRSRAVKRARDSIREAAVKEGTLDRHRDLLGCSHRAGCQRRATIVCGGCKRLSACEEHADKWICDMCECVRYCDTCAPERGIGRCGACGLFACQSCMPGALCEACFRAADTTEEEDDDDSSE